MHKQENRDSNRDLLNPLNDDANKLTALEKQKKNKIQSQLAQINRSRGRSPNKKYGY